MTAIVLIIRAVIVLLFLRLLGRFVMGVIQGLRTVSTPGAAPGAGPGGDMVRDRICNTFLPRERALRATVQGVEEHFCSPACRDRALSLQPAR